MKFLEEYQLAITTLTPVHIGCGEDYTPTDYVIDDDALFAFDSARINEALPEAARGQLLKLVTGRQQKNVLSKIQNLFHREREELMTRASHRLPVVPGVVKLYSQRIGKTAQQESSGNRAINKLEIERTFYNPINQQPVIPGSSLKGAVRTALLDLVNNGRTCGREETNKKLQGRLFEYNGKFEQDPMRLVQVQDTVCVNNDDIHSKIRFAVNRPGQEPKQKQTKRTMAEDKGLYQLLETLPDAGLRAYSSCLIIQKVDQLQQNEKLPARKFYWTAEQIAQACNRFYRPLLTKEMDIIRQRQYSSPDWIERMEELLESIAPMLDADKAMILRIGRHSGAEAVTLNGVRSIRIMQGKGKEPKYEPEPRTLWLAADSLDSRSNMTPFGWVLVEIDPADKLPAKLEQLFRQPDALKQDWLQKQQRRIAELQDKAAERKQREEAKRQAEIAEEQAAKEKAERLASMSDEQRAIEELRELSKTEQDNHRLVAQSHVVHRLSEHIKTAVDWPKEYRIELCDLAEEIYKPLGMLRGKKGKQRKERIELLRKQTREFE